MLLVSAWVLAGEDLGGGDQGELGQAVVGTAPASRLVRARLQVEGLQLGLRIQLGLG